MIQRGPGSDNLTPQQKRRLERYRHYQGEINHKCPVGCWGCNADQCCGEFSTPDIEAGRPCNCKDE